MKYDPILCMNVPDGKRTSDRDPLSYEALKSDIAALKKGVSYITKESIRSRVGSSFTHRTPASGGLTKEQYNELLNELDKVGNGKDVKTIDNAIRACDATTFQSAKAVLKNRIDGWYRNAKIDYGVNGRFVDLKEENGALVVYWEENGKRKKYSFGKYWNDDSPEQLYNIWMEQAD